MRTHDALLRSGVGPDGPAVRAWWVWRRVWDAVVACRRGDLARFEARTSSQHGEDGIIAEVLRRVSVDGPAVAVEIGSGDGSENCTRALLDSGWRTVWIEADPDRAAAARLVTPAASVVEARVDAANIAGLLDAAGVPAAFEVLVIDIDGNDHAVLDRVLARSRPRLIVA